MFSLIWFAPSQQANELVSCFTLAARKLRAKLFCCYSFPYPGVSDLTLLLLGSFLLFSFSCFLVLFSLCFLFVSQRLVSFLKK